MLNVEYENTSDSIADLYKHWNQFSEILDFLVQEKDAKKNFYLGLATMCKMM